MADIPRPTGADNSRQSPYLPGAPTTDLSRSETDRLYYALTGHWPMYRYWTLRLRRQYNDTFITLYYQQQLRRNIVANQYHSSAAGWSVHRFRTTSQSPLPTED